MKSAKFILSLFVHYSIVYVLCSDFVGSSQCPAVSLYWNNLQGIIKYGIKTVNIQQISLSYISLFNKLRSIMPKGLKIEVLFYMKILTQLSVLDIFWFIIHIGCVINYMYYKLLC